MTARKAVHARRVIAWSGWLTQEESDRYAAKLTEELSISRSLLVIALLAGWYRGDIEIDLGGCVHNAG